MTVNNVYPVYFSPGSTTKTVISEISRHFNNVQPAINLLDKPGKRTFTESDLVIIGLPVFAGRLPSASIDMLYQLKGSNTPAVIVAVYGNRDYEDALVELLDIMTVNGFKVFAAAAFIGRHSLFNMVATQRPDAQDFAIASSFAKDISIKLQNDELSTPEIKGNRPYKERKEVGIAPKTSKACTNCGVCVNICPTGAIAADNPRKTDKTKCSTCTACIYACKQNARSLDGFFFRLLHKKFAKKFSARKDVELFI